MLRNYDTFWTGVTFKLTANTKIADRGEPPTTVRTWHLNRVFHDKEVCQICQIKDVIFRIHHIFNLKVISGSRPLLDLRISINIFETKAESKS